MRTFLITLLFFLSLLTKAQLLTTAWNSNCYYNYYQPIDASGPCNRCYVSSTSVAMGQVMKYWQHPKKGWGTQSYVSNYGAMSANFEHNYNWTSIPNSLSYYNYDLARLLTDCEVSIQTNYSPYFYNYSCGLVNLDTVRKVMSRNFGYKNGTIIQHNGNPNFENQLQNEVAHNRPVIMEVYPYNNQCSKFCVVDGYNPTSQNFHVNWGYGSYYNVWTKLDTMQFANLTWGLTTTALIGLEPDTITIQIEVKYDQTNNYIPSYLVMNNTNYSLPSGSLVFFLRKGWYDAIVYTFQPWANCNSVDALLVMKHFVGTINLTGLSEICSDVNADGTINSTDALMIAKRYTHIINSFNAGDWKFETFNTNDNIIITIHGRCIGDVN